MLAVVLATVAVVPASAGAVVVGIGDNSPAFLTDPRFIALGIREARLIVPWNTGVTRSGVWRSAIAAWLRAAATDRVIPLVSFAGTGPAPPSLAAYTQAVRRFVAEFPTVQRFTAWNEPDWVYRPALSRHPRLAASYYNALSAACPTCLVLAGDLYLPGPQLAPWLRQYAAALHKRPVAWALHDYYDVHHRSTAQLRVMLRYTSGQIWLDETGGVETRRNWHLATPAQAAANEQFLFSTASRYPRVSRIYHYQWQVTTTGGWDSALIGPDGQVRPAYNVLARFLHLT